MSKINNKNDSIMDYTTVENKFEGKEDEKILELHKNFADTSNCNKEILLSYGFEGLSTPEMIPNKLCPLLGKNCCSLRDFEKIKVSWKNTHKKKIETYFNTYIIAIRYLLGFFNQIQVLANEFKDSNIESCKAAAQDQIFLDLNSDNIKEIFSLITESINKMASLRENFFCLLCDINSQTSLNDYWSSTNRVKNKVYLSKDFCTKLVNDSIETSFNRIIYITKYLNSIFKLINCKNGIHNNLKLDLGINQEIIDSIQSCKYYGQDNLFFNCESYCQNYHLTKPSAILEGNVSRLLPVFTLVKDNRKKIFNEFSNNFLSENLTFDEDFLTNKFENENFKNYVFFESTTQSINLNSFDTDVVYFGGMDPYSESLKSTNEVYLFEKSIFIFHAFKILILLLFTF